MRLVRVLRNNQRGDVDIGLVVVVGLLAVGSSVFFLVKDWVKETKDRRHGLGEFAYREGEEKAPLPAKRGPRGYVVTFNP